MDRARETERVVPLSANPPPVWNPTGVARRFSPLLGNHTGCYVSEACGRGLCVPGWLGAQWSRQFMDDAEATRHIAAFVGATLAALPPGPVGDEMKKFWPAQWAARHPSHAPAPRVSGKGDATKAAVERALANFVVRGQAS